MCAYQRLNNRKNVWRNVGNNEEFFNVNDYSIFIRVENNAVEDEQVDKMEQDGNEMEEDSDDTDEMLEKNSAGKIYCSICKEIFLEPRSLAKHIIKEHCSKGRL